MKYPGTVSIATRLNFDVMDGEYGTGGKWVAIALQSNGD